MSYLKRKKALSTILSKSYPKRGKKSTDARGEIRSLAGDL